MRLDASLGGSLHFRLLIALRVVCIAVGIAITLGLAWCSVPDSLASHDQHVTALLTSPGLTDWWPSHRPAGVRPDPGSSAAAWEAFAARVVLIADQNGAAHAIVHRVQVGWPLPAMEGAAWPSLGVIVAARDATPPWSATPSRFPFRILSLGVAVDTVFWAAANRPPNEALQLSRDP